MRNIPEELAVRIESGAATLCHVWRVTRVDGQVSGHTDHDGDLVVEGLSCRAASGWTVGAGDGEIGLAPGSLSAGGALDDVLNGAEIAAGALDGARVELWRVDWRRPDLKVALWSGTMTRVRREGEAFVAELEGPMAALDRVVGRTYGRDCDAMLGDARCRVDVGIFPGLACDKRWATCGTVFDNGLNFQGFPDIPGDDFLTAYPAEGGRHDGGSRR